MVRAGLGLLAFVFFSSPALAHSPIPGIGGFYQGLLHPFSTPAQALLMLGLGVVAAVMDSKYTRWFLLTFCISVGAGMAWPENNMPDASLYGVAIAASALAALAVKSLYPLVFIFLVIGGGLIGIVSIPDGGLMRDRVIVMSGSFVGANIAFLYISGFLHLIAERYPFFWVPIAYRVAAAWIAAISAIMLAFQFAPVEVVPGA
ncbi:HupE/UreJ family protein [Labrenzia sp. PHM005]|uniref:HupE/UreJ family protein n=1 Tax=Labrenzia sp. PHM005 TaxID=2590016 RepID=UPI00114058AC|nr:HupE/UreJ family protein [Labrenzia sp. PHM005]QDG77700.1 hypothetical protein FJ695_18545 [Labrenzia sp. PHM005]